MSLGERQETLIVRPLDCGGSYGVVIEAADQKVSQSQPVGASLDGEPITGRVGGYHEIVSTQAGFGGSGRLMLGDEAWLDVEDDWTAVGGDIVVDRQVVVHGTLERGFLTSCTFRWQPARSWSDVKPFIPGVVYGDSMPVPERSLLGQPARAAGLRHGIVREDRMSAPVFAVQAQGSPWFGVLHLDPTSETTVADGEFEMGADTMIDERLTFASLGGVATDDGLELGLWIPGTEGENTYSSGGLPLLQLHAWRFRYHPVRHGLVQRYRVAFTLRSSTDTPGFYRSAWRWAWGAYAPTAPVADIAEVLRDCADVLASQVAENNGVTGVALEEDAADPAATDLSSAAVMGFVGANTDAAYVLMRAAAVGSPAEFGRMGERVIESFTTIGMDPPMGEGFDLATGDLTTYREFRGSPAVYARSVAEGCLAVLDAVTSCHEHRHDAWLAWARSGGDWLARNQAADGSIARAWAAGSGDVLDPSTSASFVSVPFLTRLASMTGDSRYLEVAIAAAEFNWRHGGDRGCFAGATLDNPDVVDKEAAVLSLEGFLDLHAATGQQEWLARAEVAATLAETWIYIWNVPMPIDAEPSALHWKPGEPTVGHQLIATGVSMTDGFLAVNAAAFARLYAATGDRHYLDIARLVTHGTKTMLATRARPFDLRGPGWQQEHWCFAVRRGFGLNRRWLPWVEVAHLRGIFRIQDLGPDLAAQVLQMASPKPSRSL